MRPPPRMQFTFFIYFSIKKTPGIKNIPDLLMDGNITIPQQGRYDTLQLWLNISYPIRKTRARSRIISV